MVLTRETAAHLLGALFVATGLVARLRGRAAPTGVLAFVGVAVAQIPNLVAALAR